MMAEKRMVPEIRFAGFEGEWEEKQLEEICATFIDGDWIESKDQSSEGIRLLQTGNVGVNQFVDKADKSKWISLDTFFRLKCEEVFPGDMLISRLPEPAGRACIVPDIGQRMITAVDCTIVRLNEKSSAKYVVQYLSSMDYFNEVNDFLAGGTRQRISRSNLASFVVPTPPTRNEQEHVGKLLGNLDNLIDAQQRKVDKLAVVKKAMLEKMFPKDGANVPEIRFAGFSGKWVRRRVGELLTERNIQSPQDGEYPLMAFIAYEGVAPKGERYNRDFLVNDKANKKYKRTEYGDFIYSSNNLTTGSIGLNNYGKASISPVYSIFQTTDLSEPNFIGRLMTRKSFIDEMVCWRQGVVYGQWRIHESDFVQIETMAPSLLEQSAIGTYFRTLDRLTTLQTQKLAKLKTIKQALLAKMFV